MANVGPTPEQLGEVQLIQLPDVEGQGFQRGTGAWHTPLTRRDLIFLPVCIFLALRAGVLDFGLWFSSLSPSSLFCFESGVEPKMCLPLSPLHSSPPQPKMCSCSPSVYEPQSKAIWKILPFCHAVELQPLRERCLREAVAKSHIVYSRSLGGGFCGVDHHLLSSKVTCQAQPPIPT